MKTIRFKHSALLLLIAALAVMISCTNESTSPEDPVLTVTNSSAVLVFSADGTTLTANGTSIIPSFTVTTNQPSWDAKVDQTWLKIAKSEDQFALSVDAYTELNELPPAKVTVSAGNATDVILVVTQLCPSPEESEYADQSIILGRGYDVTGNYANSAEVKSAILDFTKLARAGMMKRDGNMQKGEFYTSSGTTSTEYCNSLAVQAGISAQVGVQGVGGFSSELTAKYSQERITKDAYSFATSTSRITKDAYFVENRRDPVELQQYVSAAFLSDLESKTGEEIINKYGTHVMLGGIWGARLDYHFSAKKRIEAYTRDIGVSFSAKAEMSAQGITAGAGQSTSVQDNYASNYDSSTEEKYTIAYGGKPEYAQSIHNKDDYDKWIESIEGNEIWTDYYPESLVPIYEFIGDEGKRSIVQKAYINYLAGKKITVTSSKINAITNYDFTLIHNGNSIIGKALYGDGEIDSKDGKMTKWEMEVALSKENTQIVANFAYTVTEGGTGTVSVIEVRGPIKVSVNKDDFIIDEKPVEWYTGVQELGLKTHDWIQVTGINAGQCPFMYDYEWWIKIDDSGRSDHEKVGVKGKLRIKYSYLE